jgi:hypothetical protein
MINNILFSYSIVLSRNHRRKEYQRNVLCLEYNIFSYLHRRESKRKSLSKSQHIIRKKSITNKIKIICQK